jgi:hypothetical protein
VLKHKGVPSSGMLVVAATVAAHPRAAELSGGERTSRPVLMMIDTGARFSVVTETVIFGLGVAPIGSTDVRTSLQQVVERPVYRIIVGLEFEDEYGAPRPAQIPLTVIASPPVPANLPKEMAFRHEGLLGLDFLRTFRFIYDGPTNSFLLTCDDLPVAATRSNL